MRVRWDDLSETPSVYEDMVAVLLSRIYSTSQRVDGTGGDGGRDVYFGPPHDLSVFELKSFTGRVDDSRRAQIKRSLERATLLNPTIWTLVVPIDPNPTEID